VTSGKESGASLSEPRRSTPQKNSTWAGTTEITPIHGIVKGIGGPVNIKTIILEAEFGFRMFFVLIGKSFRILWDWLHNPLVRCVEWETPIFTSPHS
jgi:hypothetical protein